MKVKDLRKLIEGVDGEMDVLIPCTTEFDGAFYSPCVHDSGVSWMGTDMNATEEDFKEAELINKKMDGEESLLLIPCGFGSNNKHEHKLN